MTDFSTEVEILLPYDTVAAQEARAHVRAALQSFEEPVVDDASLLVTEVVANAVEHGNPEVRLGVRVHPDRAHVAVEDGDPTLPPPPQLAEDDAEGRRGLTLVSELADRWGAEPAPTGKRVWFELAHHSDGGGPERGSADPAAHPGEASDADPAPSPPSPQPLPSGLDG